MSDAIDIPEIWVDRARQGGEPCIGGTRVPVRAVMLLGGDEAIMAAYPRLTRRQIAGARAFWARWRPIDEPRSDEPRPSHPDHIVAPAERGDREHLGMFGECECECDRCLDGDVCVCGDCAGSRDHEHDHEGDPHD